MMIAAAECLPLGILQIVYSQRVGKTGLMEMLSLVTTWAMYRVLVRTLRFIGCLLCLLQARTEGFEVWRAPCDVEVCALVSVLFLVVAYCSKIF